MDHRGTPADPGTTSLLVADTGDAGALTLPAGGTWAEYALTVGAGAETRTLAVPTARGQRVKVWIKTSGGGSVGIAVAQPYNVLGDTTITLLGVRSSVVLEAISDGANLRWLAVGGDATGESARKTKSVKVTIPLGAATVNTGNLGMLALGAARVVCSLGQAAEDATAIRFWGVVNGTGVDVKSNANATAAVDVFVYVDAR